MNNFLDKNSPFIVFFIMITFFATLITDYQLHYGVQGTQTDKGIVIEEIVRRESDKHDAWDAFYYKIIDTSGKLLTVPSKLISDPKTVAGDSVTITYNLKGGSKNSLFYYRRGETTKEIKSVTKISK